MSTQRIGHYLLLEEVGSGGQAVVWRARDLRTGQEVAIKSPLPGFATNPDYITRFHREAKILTGVDHPNVIKILGHCGEEQQHGIDDPHYLALEFAPKDLYTVIEEARNKKERGLPVLEAVRIAREVALALEAVSSKAVHRDIKPGNILFDKEGRVKVTDFGVGRAVTISTSTGTRSMVGTVGYMPPEAYKFERADIRFDIWGLGITLFEMLAGERPFLGTDLQIMRQVDKVEHPSIRELRPDVPAYVEEIINKCLEKDRSRRYQTPRELVLALEGVLSPGMAGAVETRELPRSGLIPLATPSGQPVHTDGRSPARPLIPLFAAISGVKGVGKRLLGVSPRWILAFAIVGVLIAAGVSIGVIQVTGAGDESAVPDLSSVPTQAPSVPVVPAIPVPNFFPFDSQEIAPDDNGRYNMSIDNPDIAIKSLTITTGGDGGVVTFSFTSRPGEPVNPDLTPSAAIIQYVEITHWGLTDLAIDSVDIAFTVERAWLNDNGFSEDDVKMWRYTDLWTALPTEITDRRENVIQYKAQSPGLSQFAITASKQDTAPDLPPIPFPTPTPIPGATPTPVPPAPTPIPSPVLSTTPTPAPSFIATPPRLGLHLRLHLRLGLHLRLRFRPHLYECRLPTSLL